MESFPQKKFSSPEEEITFLRNEIARREREVLTRNKELDSTDRETLSRAVIREYAEHDPSIVLDKKHMFTPHAVLESRGFVETAPHKTGEIIRIAYEKGIRNAMSVLERMDDAFLTDDVHRAFVDMLRTERRVADLREDEPLWKVLSMTLFEVSLPRHADEGHETNLKTLFSGMEQFYAGMQTVTEGKEERYYTIEIAVSDKTDEIIFYVAVPNEFVNLFEKHAQSLFPNAVLHEQQNDYNIFVEGGATMLSVAELKRHSIYPLKEYDMFENDPLAVLLNAFSKIEKSGGGASIQVVIGGGSGHYHAVHNGIIRRMEHGESTDVAIRKSTLGGELFEGFKSMLVSSPAKKKDAYEQEIKGDADKIELFNKKIATPIQSTNVRIAVSAHDETRARQILTELQSCFNQFQDTKGNQMVFRELKGAQKHLELKHFSFREYNKSRCIPLSMRELATIIHFPAEGIESSPQFKQSHAKHAPAPVDLPKHGTLVGENEFRNKKTEVYLTPLDRLRHLYVIGQTGTGKTTLLKNMIIQDIRDGAGVCMIDPHGTDIVDVPCTHPHHREYLE